MKACEGGNSGTAPVILDLDTRLMWLFKLMSQPLYPQEEYPVPFELDTKLAPERVWTFGGENKFLALPEFLD